MSGEPCGVLLPVGSVEFGGRDFPHSCYVVGPHPEGHRCRCGIEWLAELRDTDEGTVWHWHYLRTSGVDWTKHGVSWWLLKTDIPNWLMVAGWVGTLVLLALVTLLLWVVSA
jgi:hypothetical protein